MSEVDVKIGTGSFEDFHVHIDRAWPTTPRVGEAIQVDRGDGDVENYIVKAVQYAVGAKDELIGVRVLVKRVRRIIRPAMAGQNLP